MIPVSTLLKNYYGVSDVCLSVPSVINRKGISRHLVVPLNEAERKKLKNSASIIKAVITGASCK